MTVRVLLADDHPIVRAGLQVVLAANPNLHLVGETGDGLDVMPMVARLKPDVLVLDLMMPGLGGLEIADRVRRNAPETRVIILSMHDNEAYVVAALQAGALGYVLKKSASGELIRAIEDALEGRQYLSPALSQEALNDYREQLDQSHNADPQKNLTPRERQVFHLVVEGLTNRQIGRRLKISPRTAEMHRANLMRKLGVQTTADLIRYALRIGILPPD
jgi:DNA-binding NarL/FixJ family response regulator